MLGRQLKVSRSISPILTLKLVAMATSLKRSGKKRIRSVIYDQKAYLPCGEKLVKIGPVDPEIILLRGLFRKEKKRN